MLLQSLHLLLWTLTAFDCNTSIYITGIISNNWRGEEKRSLFLAISDLIAITTESMRPGMVLPTLHLDDFPKVENSNIGANLSCHLHLHSTTVAALDELYALIGLQELLEIALEQLQRVDLVPEERRARTVLLIMSYLEQVKPCLENIEVELAEIRTFAPSMNNRLGGAA